MTYSLKIKPSLEKVFEKLSNKDHVQLEAIQKKVKQIIEDPYRFKPLHAPMQHLRRVHIMSSFVLVYAITENEKTVELVDYDHHDSIYKK